eukprot:3869110-Amphidinium_carterae.1
MAPVPHRILLMKHRPRLFPPSQRTKFLGVFCLEGARAAMAADFDGDGLLDLVAASSNDNTVAWYRRLEDGSYSAKQMITRASNGARIVAVGDIDQDCISSHRLPCEDLCNASRFGCPWTPLLLLRFETLPNAASYFCKPRSKDFEGTELQRRFVTSDTASVGIAFES